MRVLKVTPTMQAKALQVIKEWMGEGEEPVLMPKFEGCSGPVPAIVYEGGPHEWPIFVGQDPDVHEALTKIGVWCEPYSGWALCLYRTEV